jgi:hypothetical protein
VFGYMAETYMPIAATSPSAKPLWASLLKDRQTKNDRQRSCQRIILIVLKIYCKIAKLTLRPETTLKNGA